jgi:transposase
MQITTVGLDLAKHIFQVHAVDGIGQAVVRKRLRRAELLSFLASLPPCLIGMEACATSHHWARELIKLGHTVKLMPPAYVKAYGKRGKTDAADAEAICEAVARPSMRFVPVNSAEQQSVLMLHRARALLIRQRTMLVNALRGHLAEFGIIVAQGISRIRELIAILTDESPDAPLSPLARRALAPLVDQLLDLQPRIRGLEAELLAWHRQSQESRRLETIPGVGFITATPSRRLCRIHPSSAPAGSLPLGSGSHRGRTPPVARSGWGGSPRWGMATCGRCWWSVPRR